MTLMTHPSLRTTAVAASAALRSRSRMLAALIAVTLALGLAGPTAADSAGPPADLRVGHTVKRISVPGSALCPDPDLPCELERRAVDVHLWYPADHRGLSSRQKTVYTSALHGEMLPAPADPLSWTVEADIARENAPIDPSGKPLPVIVFSHGSTNDPIDYAHTLEAIAGAGFVVAAPSHVNNTQDDARIDEVNRFAGFPTNPPWFTCNDRRPPPCSRPSVPFSMADRVRDISHILDALPGWFGDRVDASRAGVLGHSRGTVTALAAAGGSAAWGFDREERVEAIMGMAIGARPVTFGANLENVDVPTVLVAGGRDQNSVQAVSEEAFAAISSADRLFVAIPNATHRSFDSTYCAQLQSAGAAFDTDGDGVVEPPEATNPLRILDRHTVVLIAASAPGGLSGKAVHYCAADFFTNPVDITELVRSTPNTEFPPSVGSVCVTTSIPCTGLETEEVKQGVKEIAVAFFDSALKRTGNDGIHFTRYLAPKWLMKHAPMVGSAEAYAGPGSICPPGQGVICPH